MQGVHIHEAGHARRVNKAAAYGSNERKAAGKGVDIKTFQYETSDMHKVNVRR